MVETILVASRKGLIRYARGDGGFRHASTSFLGEPVSCVLYDRRDGTLYAALRLGHFGVKLHRSENGGEDWTEVAAPAFPPTAEGVAEAKSLDMVWSLAAGGAEEPGVIWAGTLPAAVMRSTDRGASWSRMESLWERPERADWFGGGYDDAGVHSLLVDPRDHRKLTIAISSGGVWKSDDAGATWRHRGQGLRNEYMPPGQEYDLNAQDPHLIVACPADPRTVWCQHHNGIFLSRDGAETFAEIKPEGPSAFGFAVAAHPADPDTAWFVPAIKDEYRVPVDGRLVVNKTTDGGGSFTAHGEGLPARDCYDLIYRHGLAVDDGGEVLAIGSTTGNLWISEDGGRRWAHLAGHLPPIAQVIMV